MRPVLAGDVFALSHYLLMRRRGDAFKTCLEVLQEVDCADKYRKRIGHVHRQWGNGSVMGRLGMTAPQFHSAPAFQCPEFCAALAIALSALRHWRNFKHHRSGRSERSNQTLNLEFHP